MEKPQKTKNSVSNLFSVRSICRFYQIFIVSTWDFLAVRPLVCVYLPWSGVKIAHMNKCYNLKIFKYKHIPCTISYETMCELVLEAWSILAILLMSTYMRSLFFYFSARLHFESYSNVNVHFLGTLRYTYTISINILDIIVRLLVSSVRYIKIWSLAFHKKKHDLLCIQSWDKFPWHCESLLPFYLVQDQQTWSYALGLILYSG